MAPRLRLEHTTRWLTIGHRHTCFYASISKQGRVRPLSVNQSQISVPPAIFAIAKDQIDGTFTGFAVGAPLNDTLSFTGFIDNAAIGLPVPPYVVNAIGPSPIAFPPPPSVYGPLVAAVGPTFTLSGNLQVTLRAFGDELMLPNSAVVGTDISGTPITTPEPRSFALAMGGVAMLFGVACWRRSFKMWLRQ